MDDLQRARLRSTRRLISARSTQAANSYVARPEHVEISVDDFEEKEEAVDEEKAEEETCSICLDGGVDRALSCGHAFHDACLADLVRSRVDEARVRDIRCPGTADAPACDVALSDDEVRGLLDAEGRDRYARFLRLAEDPAAVECPSCGAAAAGEGVVTCGVCFLDFCKVHGTAHPPDAASCRRFARRHRRAERRSRRAVENLSKPCPGCGAPVCKSSGCNHMTCSCGTNFCWLCGDAIVLDGPEIEHAPPRPRSRSRDTPSTRRHFRVGACAGLQLAAAPRDGSLVARGVHEFAASRCASRVLGTFALLLLSPLALLWSLTFGMIAASAAFLPKRFSSNTRILYLSFIMIYLLLRVAGHIKSPVTLDIIVVVLAFATTPCLIANARVLGSSSSEVTTWACIPCLLFHIVAELPEAWNPMVWIRSLERRERWFLEVTPRRDGRRRGGQWRPRRVPASPTADAALPDLLPVSPTTPAAVAARARDELAEAW